ncbi:MAG: class I SAM-dependent methyltransferase [candidate division Zixibacteria bacterium]
MNKDHEINRKNWNARTDAHYKHPEYRVKEFLNGSLKLHPLELKEVGDVNGKSLLHLQCHFGLDTLSWARLGAKVTGIDISDRSIELANELKDKAGLEARFIRTDLFNLPEVLDEEFDIVFTSYGVLWWMSDIKRWAKIVAQYVRRDGFFYIADGHPVMNMLDKDKRVFEPYFNQGVERYYDEGDYCDKDLKIEEECGWRWTLSDVINALIGAGLTLEYIHEFPFCCYDHWPNFVKDKDGWYYYPDMKKDVPMTFSIKAVKR